MSDTQIKFAGFEEFKAQLRNLPHHLAEEAAKIVNDRAERAYTQIYFSYPEGPTGNLRRGLKFEQVSNSSGTGVIARVRSRAKHAYMVEHGTQTRHTNKGWNRGVMPPAPPGHYVIPVAVRERRAMIEDLIAMLRREGLTVAGRG